MPVAPTSICPVASAGATGAAAWKKTSSGSLPISLKKPFSTPMKSVADEVSLSAPTLTFCWACAGAAPTQEAAAQTAKTSAVIRRIEKPPLVTCVVLGMAPRHRQPLAARERPMGEQAEEREHHDPHHELGGVHDV